MTTPTQFKDACATYHGGLPFTETKREICDLLNDTGGKLFYMDDPIETLAAELLLKLQDGKYFESKAEEEKERADEAEEEVHRCEVQIEELEKEISKLSRRVNDLIDENAALQESSKCTSS